MNPDPILDEADARLSAWLPTIAQAQAAYLAAHGRYAQALPLTTQTPADGAEVPVDNAEAAPTDQPQSWLDLAPDLPETVMSRVWIDTYEGPQGAGYVVCAELIIEGVTYLRRIDPGPESRGHGWFAAEGE